eukprot:gene4736-6643_t
MKLIQDCWLLFAPFVPSSVMSYYKDLGDVFIRFPSSSDPSWMRLITGATTVVLSIVCNAMPSSRQSSDLINTAAAINKSLFGKLGSLSDAALLGYECPIFSSLNLLSDISSSRSSLELFILLNPFVNYIKQFLNNYANSSQRPSLMRKIVPVVCRIQSLVEIEPLCLTVEYASHVAEFLCACESMDIYSITRTFAWMEIDDNQIIHSFRKVATGDEKEIIKLGLTVSDRISPFSSFGAVCRSILFIEQSSFALDEQSKILSNIVEAPLKAFNLSQKLVSELLSFLTLHRSSSGSLSFKLSQLMSVLLKNSKGPIPNLLRGKLSDRILPTLKEFNTYGFNDTIKDANARKQCYEMVRKLHAQILVNNPSKALRIIRNIMELGAKSKENCRKAVDVIADITTMISEDRFYGFNALIKSLEFCSFSENNSAILELAQAVEKYSQAQTKSPVLTMNLLRMLSIAVDESVAFNTMEALLKSIENNQSFDIESISKLFNERVTTDSNNIIERFKMIKDEEPSQPQFMQKLVALVSDYVDDSTRQVFNNSMKLYEVLHGNVYPTNQTSSFEKRIDMLEVFNEISVNLPQELRLAISGVIQSIKALAAIHESKKHPSVCCLSTFATISGLAKIVLLIDNSNNASTTMRGLSSSNDSNLSSSNNTDNLKSLEFESIFTYSVADFMSCISSFQISSNDDANNTIVDELVDDIESEHQNDENKQNVSYAEGPVKTVELPPPSEQEIQFIHDNIAIMSEKVVVGNLIDCIVILKYIANIWCRSFHCIAAVAKYKSFSRNNTSALSFLNTELELDYILRGIECLRGLEACKLGLHKRSAVPGVLSEQDIAQRETREIRELLALVPIKVLPTSIREAFKSVNIHPSESFGHPIDFTLPTVKSTVDSGDINQLFSNDVDKWCVEQRKEEMEILYDEDNRFAIGQDNNILVDDADRNLPDVVNAFEKNNQQNFMNEIEINIDDVDFTQLGGGGGGQFTNGQKPPFIPFSVPSTINVSNEIRKQVKSTLQSNASEYNDVPTTTTLDFNLNDGNGESVSAGIKSNLSTAAMKKQIEIADLSKIYGQKVNKRGAEESHVDDFDVQIIKVPVEGHWTYQRLAESKALQKMMAIVLNNLRNLLVEVHQHSEQPLRIDVLCIFDDSCSMSIFEHHIFETMVHMIEVLRKLECQFAIGRFAGRKVHGLLKDFDTPFTMQLGELILERMTCAGKGTCPLDALASFIPKVWPNGAAQPPNNQNLKVHKIVLCVTDGLTDQARARDYAEVCSKYDANLHFLLLHDATNSRVRLSEVQIHAHKAEIENENKQLQSRQQNSSQDSNKRESEKRPDEMGSLPIMLGDALNSEFIAIRDKVLSISGANSKLVTKAIITKATIRQASYRLSPTTSIIETLSPAKLDEVQSLFNIDLNDLIRQKTNTTITQLFNVSDAAASLPFGDDLDAIIDFDDSSNDSLDRTRRETLVEELRALELLYDQITNKLDKQKVIAEADIIWNNAEDACQAVIDDLVLTLEESVLPYNKYTRRKGDMRGANLYIPRLIKAIASDFTYKKFFANLSAGVNANTE